jgi:hypothetical protein
MHDHIDLAKTALEEQLFNYLIVMTKYTLNTPKPISFQKIIFGFRITPRRKYHPKIYFLAVFSSFKSSWSYQLECQIG